MRSSWWTCREDLAESAWHAQRDGKIGTTGRRSGGTGRTARYKQSKRMRRNQKTSGFAAEEYTTAARTQAPPRSSFSHLCRSNCCCRFAWPSLIRVSELSGALNCLPHAVQAAMHGIEPM